MDFKVGDGVYCKPYKYTGKIVGINFQLKTITTQWSHLNYTNVDSFEWYIANVVLLKRKVIKEYPIVKWIETYYKK